MNQLPLSSELYPMLPSGMLQMRLEMALGKSDTKDLWVAPEGKDFAFGIRLSIVNCNS